MSILFKNISQGFASLGNFFGEAAPSLPKAPRNRGEAWQRDWRKIGSDFQSAEVKLGLVDSKTTDLVGDINAQLHIAQLRLLSAKKELTKIREASKKDNKALRFFWVFVALNLPMIASVTSFLILFAVPPLKDYLEIELTMSWFLTITILIYFFMIVFGLFPLVKDSMKFKIGMFQKVRVGRAVKDKSSQNET